MTQEALSHDGREAIDRRQLTAILKLSSVGLLLIAVGGVVVVVVYGASFDVAAIRNVIQAWGAWGVLASVGLMVIHSFAVFPWEVVAVVNGMVYGPFWGTLITWVGLMLGASLAFGLARHLGRRFVHRLVAKNRWSRLDDWAEARAGHLVFISRFVPIISFNLINYAAGLTRMSWWAFLRATGVGILPLIVVTVVLGDQIENLTWEMWLLLGVAVSLLWFTLRRNFRLPTREEEQPTHDRTPE